MKGGLDEECDIMNDANIEACKEYNEKMEALSAILQAQAQPMKDLQALVSEVKAIKIQDPSVVNTPAPLNISAEIAAAKKASEEFGPTSSEAQLAWEVVEEIASADNSQAYASALNADECLTDLSEACQALTEINRLVEGGAKN
jgi:leucyl aminopeptidase (aminopeptidase T)